MAQEKCAHPGCNCKVEERNAVNRENQMYCSTQCANSGSSGGSGSCGCGHSDCH